MKYRQRYFVLLTVVFSVCLTYGASGQTLNFSNHREVEIPDYATVRIGPFYSTLTFYQYFGYRYVASSGAGVDFLFSNRRGEVRKDGSDLPLITTLNFRNYLFITRHCDLDLSFAASYEYYPLETQESAFFLDPAEEGLFGNISMELQLTPVLKATILNNLVYRTDYVDTRGYEDPYGGRDYRYFSNKSGVDMDWLMARDKNLAFSVSLSRNIPEEDEFMDQDLTSIDETLKYEQKLNPFIVAGLDTGFGQNTYNSGERPDSVYQTYSLFGNIRLTKSTSGSASAGYAMGTASGTDESQGEKDLGMAVGKVAVKSALTRTVSHSFEYDRGFVVGYNAAFELNNTYQYRLDLKGRWNAKMGIYSRYMDVEPTSETINQYSDWATGMDISYPLTPFVALQMVSEYLIRANGSIESGAEPVDVEWQSDYNTWRNRIGTSFAIFEDIGLTAYIQHVNRTSDSADLEYERLTASVMFNYKHKF